LLGVITLNWFAFGVLPLSINR